MTTLAYNNKIAIMIWIRATANDHMHEITDFVRLALIRITTFFIDFSC